MLNITPAVCFSCGESGQQQEPSNDSDWWVSCLQDTLSGEGDREGGREGRTGVRCGRENGLSSALVSASLFL